MAEVELFSQRRKRELGIEQDVYVYDRIPQGLRVQIIHIWNDSIGNQEVDYQLDRHIKWLDTIRNSYQAIVNTLRREYGVFTLFSNRYPNNNWGSYDELKNFFLGEAYFERVMDVIELSFSYIESVTNDISYLGRSKANAIATDSIQELNRRFRQHAVGYYYSTGKLITIDSEYLHAEVVKPALIVLHQDGYENALSEFLDAHEHYRHGRNSEALVGCCKAFESTMKIICSKRKWSFNPNDTASRLVNICYEKNLIPAYWQTHFGGLRSVLESAIATPRNKLGGHGAGDKPSEPPPDELVSYVLHMTAATILFLTEAQAKLP